MPADRYRWLEDVESGRVRRWALSRSEKCRSYLRPLSKKIEPRFAEIYNAPVRSNFRVTRRGVFYMERKEGEYSIELGGRKVVSSEDLGPDCVIQEFYTDDEGSRLAYSFSKGEDEGTTRVVSMPSKGRLAELRGAISSVAFLEDGFYYVRDFRKEKAPDGTDPPASRIMREGRVVFGNGVPPGHSIGVRSSHGKALVTVFQWSKTDVFFGDLGSPVSWRKAYGGDFLSFPISYVHGHLYLLSYEGDGFGRVLRDDGEVVIPERGEVIEHAEMLGDDIIVSYIADCSSRVRVFGLDGKRKAAFEPPFKSHVEAIDAGEARAVLTFASFGVPYAAYQYSDGEFSEVGSNVVADLPIGEGFAESKDGTKVHYFTVGDGRSRRVLAYGYGGFSIPRTPFYDPMFVQLAESGILCVVANLRGGNEYGEAWHKAGKLAEKQNVFDDFTAVIEEFKGEGRKVVAFGRSNGGLLVGAVMTQHPGLLDGAVIGYPVLDMLRFHRMSVGRYWVDEYGDPDKASDRKFLKSYSPYHNLRRVSYPPTLIYTSLYDDRVHPAHGFKLAAAMERKGSAPLLRVQAKGGLAGSSPRVRIKELTHVVAIIEKELGEPALGRPRRKNEG